MALAAPQTFTGKITDTMCGKKHIVPGKTDAECTRDCMKMKGAWTYGLVVGDKVYKLDGDKAKFSSLAGEQVKVTGEEKGDTIVVTAVSAAK